MSKYLPDNIITLQEIDITTKVVVNTGIPCNNIFGVAFPYLFISNPYYYEVMRVTKELITSNYDMINIGGTGTLKFYLKTGDTWELKLEGNVYDVNSVIILEETNTDMYPDPTDINYGILEDYKTSPIPKCNV